MESKPFERSLVLGCRGGHEHIVAATYHMKTLKCQKKNFGKVFQSVCKDAAKPESEPDSTRLSDMTSMPEPAK